MKPSTKLKEQREPKNSGLILKRRTVLVKQALKFGKVLTLTKVKKA